MKNHIGSFHIDSAEEFNASDFQVGDYVYGKKASCDDQSIPTGNFLGQVVGIRPRQVIVRDLADCSLCPLRFQDVFLVPLSVDWFRENLEVFEPTDELENPTGCVCAWQYRFRAFRFPAVFYIAGFDIAYEDDDERMRLLDEGLSFLDAKESASHMSTIVQIVRRIPGSPGSALAVAQLISIHELQHFLRLCGTQELQAPDNLQSNQ